MLLTSELKSVIYLSTILDFPKEVLHPTRYFSDLHGKKSNPNCFKQNLKAPQFQNERAGKVQTQLNIDPEH